MVRAALFNLVVTLGLAVAPGGALFAQSDEASFAETIEDAERREGVFDLYVNIDEGAVFAAFTPDVAGHYGRYIHSARLTAGLGSNPVGLDRGFGIGGRILRVERAGPRVMFILENPGFQALGAGAEEDLATRQSFAESVIWAGDIASVAQDGRLLVDLSGFLISDPMNLAGRLREAGEGDFSIDEGRSAPILDQALAFPRNVEIDARITLAGSRPGSEVRSVTPEPRAVTLIQHHSFVALPEDGYRPRRSDIRSGGFEQTFQNTAAPLTEPVRTGWAVRHRLQRVDAQAQSGPVREPIVFYVDRGAPEPVREALIEGASWWADAFTAAGFEDAYRVELLPEGAHPLDVRYNTIQWVHRETRGWSYGSSVVDPRTGELLKGAVILGSQRVRQDRMIFEGLIGAGGAGQGGPDDPVQIALARVRQLSAHEVGHTVGIAHNFIASTQGRASVMDYPAPLATLGPDGAIDLSQAYDTGIGEWDVAAIRWLYAEFANPADEAAGLEAILAETRDQGLLYISDAHARGEGAAYPEASLWDNGEDPVEHLAEVMAVRAAALERFGPDNLPAGRPLSELRATFVPIYLYHRYQVEAAAKAVGGRRFAYEINGSDVQGFSMIPAAEQRAALEALAATLDPAALDIADETTALLAPDPFTAYDGAVRRELFASSADPAFSRVDAARAAARLTLAAALAPEKLARAADQHAVDRTQLSPGEVLDRFQQAAFEPVRGEASRLAPIRAAVQTEYAAQLLHLAEHGAPRVAAPARARLESLAQPSVGVRFGLAEDAGHRAWLAQTVRAALARLDRGESVSPPRADIPPGSPIGTSGVLGGLTGGFAHCGGFH
ncbi:zinc-dependent metalloprotease [Maricaulaceae bacterium MS644]